MCINEKYRIRHKILDALQSKLSQFDEKEKVTEEQIELSLEEISQYSKVPTDKIQKNTDFLSQIGEINSHWIKGKLKFVIVKNGTISYYDKKHIREGRKEFWNNTYDIVKTISAVILVGIAIITFIINIIDTRQNKKDINDIKSELLQIKGNK